jgi:glycosyltransferase involved in cell wall biosynthesis
MKILFILKSLTAPSARIRCLNFFPYLEKTGFQPSAEVLPKKPLQRIKFFNTLNQYDIVLLQKKLLNPFELLILRKKSEILIFDFDDAIYHRDAACSLELKDYVHKGREKKFFRTLSKADLIIAANKELAKKAVSNINSAKIVTLPSPVFVDAENIQIKADYRLSSPVVLGWVGSKINLRYLYHIKDVFYELKKYIDFELRLVSNDELNLPGINVNLIQWNAETEYDEIKEFDIGIMPLSDEPYSRGKSAYKLLQYMTAGVPSVCSNVGMNEDLAMQNKYCLGANTNKEFAQQILKLIDDAEMRKRIGENAARLIREQYSYEVIAEKLIKNLQPFFLSRITPINNNC